MGTFHVKMLKYIGYSPSRSWEVEHEGVNVKPAAWGRDPAAILFPPTRKGLGASCLKGLALLTIIPAFPTEPRELGCGICWAALHSWH